MNDASRETEKWVSQACRYPRQQQAEIIPADRARRHPYSGSRPEFSGYCVSGDCACPCHQKGV